MIAEALPTPEHFTNTWLSILSILTMASLILGILRLWRPQRNEVTIMDSMVSKEFCKGTHHEQDRQFALMQDQFKVFSTERKTDVANLHEKINGVSREVATIGGKLEMQISRLMLVDSKLDRLIERKNQTD